LSKLPISINFEVKNIEFLKNLIFELKNINLEIITSLMSNTQSVKAVAKYIRMSPHKIRRVLDQIRGRSYQEALMILEFLPYDASGPIWQVVHSAAANAKHNYGLDKKKLIIDEVFADEGPKLKRIRPRAQGRAYKILKPTCHITVVMKEVT
jgi:large subunit ribosomal protein L22